MAAFDDVFKYLDGLQSDINNGVRKSVEKFDFVLVDFVSNKQLKRKGEDGNKDKLTTYSNPYKRIRISKGLQVNRTDLNFDGDFHKSISVSSDAAGFKVVSNVSHDKALVSVYGEDILKISDENMQVFTQDYILPEIKRTIHD